LRDELAYPSCTPIKEFPKVRRGRRVDDQNLRQHGRLLAHSHDELNAVVFCKRHACADRLVPNASHVQQVSSRWHWAQARPSVGVGRLHEPERIDSNVSVLQTSACPLVLDTNDERSPRRLGAPGAADEQAQ
jgi:hypothetical protein